MTSARLNLPEGEIFFCSLACAYPHSPEYLTEAKLKAAVSLLSIAGVKPGPPEQILLRATRLGKPELTTNAKERAAISFSRRADILWAALSLECPSIGIDAAASADFGAGYPFAKVFNPCEWNGISELGNPRFSHRASLLWSAKEAAVKMLGCGFHVVEPLHISVRTSKSRENILQSHVCVSSDPWVRGVEVYSIEHDWGWVSFAPGAPDLDILS